MRRKLHPHFDLTRGLDMGNPSDPDGAKANQAFQAKMRAICDYEKPDNLNIWEDSVQGVDGNQIAVRLYRRAGLTQTPAIMNVHGGGFTFGSLEQDDARCSYLAMAMDCAVVSVDYRLAPMNRFPSALRDCWSVWLWMHGQGAAAYDLDTEKMGLFGTSAGGNLCAALAFYNRDKEGPAIALNGLNVPMLSYRPTLSWEQMRSGVPVIGGAGVPDCWRTYLGDMDGQLPSYYAAPLQAEDYSGLPPTFIVAAEFDPLRDEAIQYAQKLYQANVCCELHVYPKVGHAFDMVGIAPMTERMRQGLCEAYRREFGQLEDL